MKNTNITALQNLVEYYYNDDYKCIDIRDSTNANEFDIANYLVEVLQHQAFKSFDGGLTFTGAITQLLTTSVNNDYGGNIPAIITNKAISTETQNNLVEEILACVRIGSENGFYEEITREDITIYSKDNSYYIKFYIIKNQERQQYVFRIDSSGQVFKN